VVVVSWKAIPGYSDDIEAFYGELAQTLPQGATVIEVGVLFGRSVACLGSLRPDIDLWAVDCWQDGVRGEHDPYMKSYGTTWKAFLGGMLDHCPEVLERLHIVRAWSTTVVLPKADVVFIDAGHERAEVVADIRHWRPQLKPGGLLAGHDYLMPNHPGVVEAVDEMFKGQHEMGPGGWTTVWKVRMP
jgi:Methyltransferase domain